MRGKTWWGAKFISALEGWMDSGRLQRGRSYTTEFRRTRFAIRGANVTATMRGNKSAYFGVTETPYYKVKVRLRKIPAAHWTRITESLGSNAEWVTHLVLGEVPPSIERALEGSPVGLLPRHRTDLRASCSCPDYANPCKHIAGVYLHLASLIDYDPLLLFELRGLDRKKLQAAVGKSEFGRALLGDERLAEPDLDASLEETERSTAVTDEPLDETPADELGFWRGGSLPRLAPEERQHPPISALMLRREGDYPEFWHREVSFLDSMAAIYERISKGLPKGSDSGPSLDLAGSSEDR